MADLKPPNNVGREVSIEKEWTPLEALGVALRAVSGLKVPYKSGETSTEATSRTLDCVKAALAEQFVKEGVKNG